MLHLQLLQVLLETSNLQAAQVAHMLACECWHVMQTCSLQHMW